MSDISTPPGSCEDDANSDCCSEPHSEFKRDTTSRGTCSWCKNFEELLSGAKYCRSCHEKSYRVCSRCKLPYPDKKFFTESGDGKRCNSCQRKYIKEREKYRLRREERQKGHKEEDGIISRKSIVECSKQAKPRVKRPSDDDSIDELMKDLTRFRNKHKKRMIILI